mgnify:CR=1 FL=1
MPLLRYNSVVMRDSSCDAELYQPEAVSVRHSRIAFNTARGLGDRLDGTPCDMLIQPIRARVSPTSFVYPDLMVVCGTPEVTDEVQDTITNPR